MRMIKLCFLLLLCALPAYAQIQPMTVIEKQVEAQSKDDLVTTLRLLNENDPLQSPRYDHSDDMLKSRILDNHNRVVGQVLDAVYDEDGELAYLYIDFERNYLGKAYIDYKKRHLRPVSNGYIMNIDEDQIKTSFPGFTKNLRQIGIENANHVLHLSRLKDAQIQSRDGRRLGQASEVLLSKRGTEVQAVFLELNYKSHQFSKLALPFDAFSVEYNGKLVKLILPDEAFDKILKFAASEE